MSLFLIETAIGSQMGILAAMRSIDALLTVSSPAPIWMRAAASEVICSLRGRNTSPSRSWPRTLTLSAAQSRHGDKEVITAKVIGPPILKKYATLVGAY